jgi:predicted ATPase/class 3 adenylate cyclase
MGEPPVGTVTFLFTDIEGSTRLARATGAVWQDVLAAHHDAVARAIERHGGYVDAIQGDAFVAAFADAREAVDAALDAQRALGAAAWPHGIEPLRVRMGVHTGYVERTELGYVGLEVHRAARVGAAAHGGQILVTAATCALLRDETEVEDLGEHRLKDFPRPQRLFHVVRDGSRATDFGPLHTAEARPTNLPDDLTELVGRDRELDHLQALLGDGTRFVTLVGAGGAGKTRLALALARRLLDDLPGGAFVVALAPVSDPAGVLPAVARALELGDDAGDLAPRLAARLGRRRSLLVLDNFEQILPGGSTVAELLERARDLRVLVTSQAPLHVRGETVVTLDALTLEAATALFTERARAAAPGWSATADEAAAIADVCERVGRLPLAVELAAARVAVLAPSELLRRLEASSDVLRNVARDAPERHRSLRATFEWSHSLLAPEHQILFAHLGAFAGPVPLDAVEAVGAADALAALEALVDFSLVRRVESPAYGWRFTMPQALRDFARDKLAASAEHDAVRRRHAEHVIAIASESRVWFAVPEAKQRRLLAIDAEIRPALRWAAAHDAELYRRLVAELGLGLVRRLHVGELIEYAERAECRLDATGAWITNCHAYGLVIAGRFEDAETTIAPAITWARREGDPRELGLVLHTLCWILDSAGQERSVEIARESLDLLRATGDRGLQQRGVIVLVQTLLSHARLDEAKEAMDASPDLFEPGTLATWLGDIALREDKPADAVPHYARSLEYASRADDALQAMNDSVGVAVALLRAGFIEAGMEAAGALAAESAETGHAGFASWGESFGFAETVETARSAPGADAAFERGRLLDPAQRVPRILALAREIRTPAAPHPAGGGPAWPESPSS